MAAITIPNNVTVVDSTFYPRADGKSYAEGPVERDCSFSPLRYAEMEREAKRAMVANYPQIRAQAMADAKAVAELRERHLDTPPRMAATLPPLGPAMQKASESKARLEQAAQAMRDAGLNPD